MNDTSGLCEVSPDSGRFCYFRGPFNSDGRPIFDQFESKGTLGPAGQDCDVFIERVSRARSLDKFGNDWNRLESAVTDRMDLRRP